MSTFSRITGMDIAPSASENQYRNLAAQSRIGSQGYQRQLGAVANRASRDANSFRPRANSALESYLSLLNRRKTDNDRSSIVTGQIAPINDAYRAGSASLQNNLQARGIGVDSSAGIGGLAALEGMRGQGIAQAQIGANNLFNQEQMSNTGQIYDLLRGRQQEAEGQESDLLSQLYAMLQGEAGQYEQLFQGEKGQRQQQQAQRQGMLGQLASAAASYFGGGFGGGNGGGGGFSTPGDATRASDYAMRNNYAVSANVPSARDAYWRKQFGL